MNLRRFVERYWDTVYPDVAFKPGWPLDAICEHLEAITDGKIKNLVISAPPGFSMSSTTGIFWPAWEWYDRGLGRHVFASVTYAEPVAQSNNVQLGPLARKLGDPDSCSPRAVANGVGGVKFAFGIFSAVAGIRLDRLVLDIPNHPMSTPAMLDGDWDVFWEHWMCRLRPGGALVVAHPRIGERDITDRILSSEGPDEFVHLSIPMKFDEFRVCETSIGWKDPRSRHGELAWPERWDQAHVDSMHGMVRKKLFDRAYQQLVMPDNFY